MLQAPFRSTLVPCLALLTISIPAAADSITVSQTFNWNANVIKLAALPMFPNPVDFTVNVAKFNLPGYALTGVFLDFAAVETGSTNVQAATFGTSVAGSADFTPTLGLVLFGSEIDTFTGTHSASCSDTALRNRVIVCTATSPFSNANIVSGQDLLALGGAFSPAAFTGSGSLAFKLRLRDFTVQKNGPFATGGQGVVTSVASLGDGLQLTYVYEQIPEPATILLVSAALLGILAVRRVARS
jgi:hypothetical protein